MKLVEKYLLIRVIVPHAILFRMFGLNGVSLPSKSRILYAVMEGVGAMPSLEGILSKEEMEIVASYVYQVTKK